VQPTAVQDALNGTAPFCVYSVVGSYSSAVAASYEYALGPAVSPQTIIGDTCESTTHDTPGANSCPTCGGGKVPPPPT
jgi:hypothetical protein